MRILICLDISEATDMILQECKKFFALLNKPEVHVFSAIDIRAMTVGEGYDSEVYKIQEEEVKQLEKKVWEFFAGHTIHFSSDVGIPFLKIIDYASEIKADLMVIGTHGRTGFNHLLFGSVAEQVLKRATCNTLVIPIKGHQS